MSTKKFAVVYCRVSTEEQAKEGLSIETQEKVCTEALVKDGYKLHSVLKDEGKSAKDFNRPAMRDIVRLVNEGAVQAIYVIHTDRISRNVKDYLVFLDLLKKQEVSLESVYQPRSDASAFGKSMDTISMVFSEMQRLITSEKVQGVMIEIAKAGYFPTYPPPGYYNTKNPNISTGIGKNMIATDPVMGPLITECFYRYARGDVNVNELADLMEAKGLRNRKGKPVKPNPLYRLLKNRLYLGEVHWGGVEVKEGKHGALIDEDTFNRVQSILSDHNKKACRRRKYQWLLNGFLVCARHGRRYTAEHHLGKKIAYYHCSNPKGCGKYVEQTELENLVAEKFKGLEFTEDFTNLVIEKARRMFMDKRKKYDSQKQGLVNRRTAFENKRKVAEEKLFTNTLSDEDFTRIRKEIQRELSQVDNELMELEDQREVNVDIAQEVLLLTRDIYKAYKKASHNLKRQYLSFFWDRFEMQDKVILNSYPTPLFDALLKLEAVYYKQVKSDNPEITNKNNKVILSTFQCVQ